MQTIYAIVAFLRRDEDKNPKYPHLLALAGNVVVYPDLIKKIDTLLDDSGQIKDSASPQLADIRRRLTTTMNSVSKILNTIFAQRPIRRICRQGCNACHARRAIGNSCGPLAQTSDQRHCSRRIGIGKTVYIEPAEVVEANNRIRELENEERREIIRILTDFTDYLRPFLPDFARSLRVFGVGRFYSCKSQICRANSCHKTGGGKSSRNRLGASRSPFAVFVAAKTESSGSAVGYCVESREPHTHYLRSQCRGKSVCLKTVGLLQYMVQCGLPIPVKENSRVGIFNDIFIDIGDEQSIENDLSTYSSHLLNMKFFLKNCNEKSLLLIDEFGSGTEPQIGAAIAEALLDQFNRKQSFGVITTHYRNLKQYAVEHPGVINGAMLYDRHQMQPLFRLSIGNPGSSFAVEIARKIGLPEEVIDRAAEIIGSDAINIDKYLQDISRDKRYWERKRSEIRHERKRASELSAKYQAELEEIEKQKKEILSQAKLQAEQLLTESNARIEKVIREIRQSQAEKERTKQVRRSLNEFRERVERKENETNERSKFRSPRKKKNRKKR